MTPTSEQERLRLVLRTLDHLEHEQLSPAALTQQVQTHCQDAGLVVSEAQVKQAIHRAQQHTGTTIQPEAVRRRTWKGRAKAVGTWLWGSGTCESSVVLLGLLVSFVVAHAVYGAAINALLATTQFSELMLLAAGISLGLFLFAGTLATSKEGEVLGKQWSSMWVPLRIVALATLLLPDIAGPAHQLINAIAYMGLKLLGS